jgi:hypothetical protein
MRSAEPQDFNQQHQRRPQQESTPKAPTVATKNSKPSTAGKFLILTVFSTVCVVNMQPWLVFAEEVLAQIKIVPLWDLLIQVPYLGGLMAFAAPHFWQVFGVSIWAFANTAQCGENLIKLFDIKDPWWVAQISKWSSPGFRAVAYIAEFCLTFFRYPPYIGGYKAAQRDFPNIDINAIDWKNAAMACLVIFAVELTLYLFVNPIKLKGVQRVKFG